MNQLVSFLINRHFDTFQVELQPYIDPKRPVLMLANHLLIGLNWAALVYAAGMIFLPFAWPDVVKALLGGILLILFDLVSEPFATGIGLWHWESKIPVQNYLTWLIIAFVFLLFSHRIRFQKQNPLALPFMFVQGTFFLIGKILGYW